MKTIGIKLQKQEYEPIEKISKTLNFGATRYLLAVPELRRRALLSCAVFQDKELCFFVDVITRQKGIEPDKIWPSLRGLFDHAYEQESLHLKWEISESQVLQFLRRMIHLNYTTLFFFLDWADQFYRTKQKDIKAYVEKRWVVK